MTTKKQQAPSAKSSCCGANVYLYGFMTSNERYVCAQCGKDPCNLSGACGAKDSHESREFANSTPPVQSSPDEGDMERPIRLQFTGESVTEWYSSEYVQRIQSHLKSLETYNALMREACDVEFQYLPRSIRVRRVQQMKDALHHQSPTSQHE